MSFYRKFIVAVGVMGLATAVCAAEQDLAQSSVNPQAMESSAPVQLADAQPLSSETDANPATMENLKVNLNLATSKELMKVKGLTATKAKAIVSYRKKHGEFKSLDALKQVKGFKKMNEDHLKNIQEQLTLG